MCATVQEIMNGNHLWNDGMTEWRKVTLYGGGIKSQPRGVRGMITHRRYMYTNYSQHIGKTTQFNKKNVQRLPQCLMHNFSAFITTVQIKFRECHTRGVKGWQHKVGTVYSKQPKKLEVPLNVYLLKISKHFQKVTCTTVSITAEQSGEVQPRGMRGVDCTKKGFLQGYMYINTPTQQ
jgi:hypothetical protein